MIYRPINRRRAITTGLHKLGSYHRVPYPGPPPLWLFHDKSRNHVTRPPWAYEAHARVRELWEEERRLRYLQAYLSWTMRHAQYLTFVDGLGPQTWHWNAVAWAAINEHIECNMGLRAVRREYRAIRAEGRTRAERNQGVSEIMHRVFPYWFHTADGLPVPARGPLRSPANPTDPPDES